MVDQVKRPVLTEHFHDGSRLDPEARTAVERKLLSRLALRKKGDVK